MKLFTAAATTLAVTATTALASSCRYLPSDASWPSLSTWGALNDTVGGRLVSTIPIGSPCHDPTYNAIACAALQESWDLVETHLDSSSSVMAPLFANQSCDPFTGESKACLLGNYVSYAINVSNVDDIVNGINFASTNNIRLVIRNTGHDFLGRSTGAGALSIWTHYLKDIEFLKFSDSFYDGSAVKVGAGVVGYEILEAASSEGLVVVSGECPTVGLAGGYTQGGGHSALSTEFGLAADQTLSYEVVTAAGAVVTASRTNNTDLYWALSGGGAGNYGVVLSMTVKTYPDAKVGGAELAFAAAYTTTALFNDAVEQFHALLPAMIDNGTMIVYMMLDGEFLINPLTAYNKTAADVKAILAPFVAILTSNSIPFTVSYTDSASYEEHYNTYMGPLPYGNIAAETYQFGGRLIPRAVVQDNNTALQSVIRNVTAAGAILVGIALDVSLPAGNSSNSVHPSWRSTLVHSYFMTLWNNTAPFSQMKANADLMTDEYVPQLAAVVGNAAYMNEADWQEPAYEGVFFGENYNELLVIKNKWDPESLFWATKAVGSDVWSVASDGSMCRA